MIGGLEREREGMVGLANRKRALLANQRQRWYLPPVFPNHTGADGVTSLLAPAVSFSVDFSEVRRAVHGIYTPLYSLIKRQTHFCIVFVDHSDTWASFLASFSWNTHLVQQQQRAWGESVRLCDCLDVWSENRYWMSKQKCWKCWRKELLFSFSFLHLLLCSLSLA